MKKILFTTPFKPFGVDNLYTRRDSFPECFHNRLTRAQGIFSYRSHFSAFGLHAIANNIEAESKVLEYPTFRRFLKELDRGYDYIGIGSVLPNLLKVKAMAEAVRERSPRTRIVVGGYCAHIDNIREVVPIDYLCTGEGVSFMRELLGQPVDYDFKNPDVYSRAHSFLGVPLLGRKKPHIIIGLGCPYGCEYCSPSHHFGRKYLRFMRTGEEIFREMERMEKLYRTRGFGFIGDDNFLLDIERAEQLRECVVKSGKLYDIFYFASPRKIAEFGPRRMAEMGTSLVWLGRESTLAPQEKSSGVDLKELVKELHRHGIKVMASTLLLMEHHTPDNIWEEMEEHIDMAPDFSMLSLYSAPPGTPLYDRMKEEGRIFQGVPIEDWNGLWRQFHYNPHFTPAEGEKIHNQALELEFQRLGPSAMRLIRVDLEGYRHMKDSDSQALRERARALAAKMPVHRALLWAMARLAPNSGMREMIEEVREQVEKDFGPTRAWEKTAGAGLWCFGTAEKIRQAIFSDVIQPPTTVTSYTAG